MAVKDLIKLYEPPTFQRSLRSQVGEADGGHEIEDIMDSLPPPRPARFIKRSLDLGTNDISSSKLASQILPGPKHSALSTNLSSTKTLTNTHDHVSYQSTCEPPFSQIPPSLPSSRIASFQHAHIPTKVFSLDDSDNGEGSQSLLKHTYPPPESYPDINDSTHKSPHSRQRPLPAHKPIPALIVFSRNAHPLNLPKLDHYLTSLPPSILGRNDSENPGDMFPPLDQLAKTGLSIDDLEANSTIAPVWKNPASILGSLQNVMIGFLGSSAIASFYSLQGLINTVQIFALILSTIVPMGGKDLEDRWRKLFLGTIPNILALNFASVIVQSLVLMIIFMTLSTALLYYFYRTTVQCDRYNSIEGLQQTETKGRQWGLMIVTFLLTILYLPLSTMSVHVLVWSEELWATPNPYKNATTFPPVLPPLGPPNIFRDTLDFCWTTTMKRNEVNFAPIVVVLAGFTFFLFAVWFPIALRRVIRQSVPKLDKFTELGRPRSNIDLDGEYHRLLDRDRNPFAFLYKGFRREWSTYLSTYLFAKLSTLIIIAVIDPDNCLFRSFSRSTIPIARQSLLLISTLGFFIAQCIFVPFLDPVNNASEWTSRLNYLSTSATAFAITLDIPGKKILDSYVLYSIYIITYGLGFYFSVISFDWTQKVVKRLTRRIDFSIDIFSPRLDISSTSIHTKRRIWQESVTALMLTDHQSQIPKEQAMVFAQARDSEFAPYLLDFRGTPGERHVENLKIYREVGSASYTHAVVLVSGPDFDWYRHLEDIIQKNYIGPDCYWKRASDADINCTNHFGNAWWIPFPPSLVIRYDDGPYAVLSSLSDLEAYITQNSSIDIERRRYVRMSLRALEGRVVQWPYNHIQPVGSFSSWCWGRRYSAMTSVHYEHAILSIKRRGHLVWEGLHLGSGFDIQLKYSRSVQVAGDVIGLNEDFDLTSSLARFLEINREIIDQGLPIIENRISHYRRYHRKECQWKSRVLTYQFLTLVYDRPGAPARLAESYMECEQDHRVRQLLARSEVVFELAHKRMKAVSVSQAATWWYIFWDDLWRRNHDTIAGLEKHEADFNPHFKTSIAYTPLPRPALESFLAQRGLFHKKPRWGDFFHTGFLNKLYLRMNDAVFRDSGQAIMFHLGDDKRELDMEDIDILTQGQPSTLGTGGGTDHDDSWIKMRPAYRWEGLLSDPPHRGGYKGRRKFLGKLGVWFGLTPLWRTGSLSNGISLDVKVEDGRYVLLDHGRPSSSTNES